MTWRVKKRQGRSEVKIKNKKDFGLGVVSILIAAFITYMSVGLRATGYEGDPGPKMFPIMGALLMAVCGILVIINPEKDEKKFLTATQWKSAGIMFLVYILIAVMLFLFGFAVAVPIMLFVVTFMLSKLSLKEASLKKRIINSLIFGAVGGAVMYLAYVVGLGAKMPTGWIWTLVK